MAVIIGIYAIPDISGTNYPALIHDHNLTILRCGSVDKYIHLERFSRNKYDASLPMVIDDISRKLKLIPSRDTKFIFVDHEIGRSSISQSGQVRFEAPLRNNIANNIEKSRLYWFGENPEAYALNHELAHIYSCIPFYGMFKENSLLVHFDGGASISNFSAWVFKNGKIDLLEAHYDLKWLSSLFNANALVFSMVGAKKKEQNAVPGKFMGLEAFGEYRYDIENWLVENNFFKDCWSSKQILFESIHATFGISLKHVDNKNRFFQDIAATVHEIFIRESMRVFNRLAKQTKAEYLYYSGGTALNIKLNRKLLVSGLFKDVFIPPCTSDSGLSIGAAVAGALHFNDSIDNSSPFISNFATENDNDFAYSPEDVSAVANEIYKGKVIGVCNGYAEAGPRALGNRSIIARADNVKLAKKISMEHKQREWYRPVAPVILEKNLYLLTGEKKAPEIAKYMLTEFPVPEGSQKYIAGCVHADGTSRIQVIKQRSFNPFLYDLLLCIDEKYGLKALLNTSFNGQGEPIVQTPGQAVESAGNMKLDYVVIDGKITPMYG